MGSRPLKSTHSKGRFTANINIRARATARPALDKPAAVNYEWACGEGDGLVNMQRSKAESPRNTSVRPPPHADRRTGASITSTVEATGRGLEPTQKSVI